MKSEHVIGLLIAIIIGLGGWTLSEIFQSHADQAVMKTELESVRKDLDSERAKNRMLWGFTTWSWQQTNSLRRADSLPDVEYPNLDRAD